MSPSAENETSIKQESDPSAAVQDDQKKILTPAMSPSAEDEGSTKEESDPSAAVQDDQKKILVRTSDGKVFELKEEVAMEMETIKSFYQEDNVSSETMTMPLPNVESREMEKVIEYCSKYIELKNNDGFDKKLKVFQADFVKSISPKGLLYLANTANYLDIQYLQDFICQAVADHIKNKDVDYVRDLFEIENDFTPEEYEMVKAEASWAHENIDKDYWY